MNIKEQLIRLLNPLENAQIEIREIETTPLFPDGTKTSLLTGIETVLTDIKTRLSEDSIQNGLNSAVRHYQTLILGLQGCPNSRAVDTRRSLQKALDSVEKIPKQIPIHELVQTICSKMPDSIFRSADKTEDAYSQASLLAELVKNPEEIRKIDLRHSKIFQDFQTKYPKSPDATLLFATAEKLCFSLIAQITHNLSRTNTPVIYYPGIGHSFPNSPYSLDLLSAIQIFNASQVFGVELNPMDPDCFSDFVKQTMTSNKIERYTITSNGPNDHAVEFFYEGLPRIVSVKFNTNAYHYIPDELQKIDGLLVKRTFGLERGLPAGLHEKANFLYTTNETTSEHNSTYNNFCRDMTNGKIPLFNFLNMDSLSEATAKAFDIAVHFRHERLAINPKII